jgi:hypothetical protein
MTQDSSSGAAANQWGRETARKIASQIDATMQRRGSNEALLDGKRVVIKCAATTTDSVGVTYKMLETLNSVIGAFQLDDGTFELWSLQPQQFKAAMRATQSRGASAGKVGIVKKSVFFNHGKLFGRVRINPEG